MVVGGCGAAEADRAAGGKGGAASVEIGRGTAQIGRRCADVVGTHNANQAAQGDRTSAECRSAVVDLGRRRAAQAQGLFADGAAGRGTAELVVGGIVAIEHRIADQQHLAASFGIGGDGVAAAQGVVGREVQADLLALDDIAQGQGGIGRSG